MGYVFSSNSERRTDVDKPIRHSLLILEHEKHLKTSNIPNCDFTFCLVQVDLGSNNKGWARIKGI